MGIGVDVRESKIGDQRPTDDTDVTALGDDCDYRSGDGRDKEPRPAIIYAQQQPGIGA